MSRRFRGLFLVALVIAATTTGAYAQVVITDVGDEAGAGSGSLSLAIHWHG